MDSVEWNAGSRTFEVSSQHELNWSSEHMLSNGSVHSDKLTEHQMSEFRCNQSMLDADASDQ